MGAGRIPTADNDRAPTVGSRTRGSNPQGRRLLRTVFWNDDAARARTPWLIALPVVGAYGTLTVVEVTLSGVLPVSVVYLLMNVAAAGAAIALVVVSRRHLGARRRLVDYGLAIDRRWRIDLLAGLGIGLAAVTIPFVAAISAGWMDVASTFQSGELTLWAGIAVIALAMLCVGLWEELTMRGVFLSTAADGLRRWLSPRRAIVGGIVVSSVVFGLAHIAQPTHPAFIVTWILSGVVFGVIYVLSGNLALPIGAHATFNIAYNVLFLRTDLPGADYWPTIMRIDVDPTLTFLGAGGVIDAAAFLLVGLLAIGWLRLSRGVLAVNPAALQVPGEGDAATPESTGRPRSSASMSASTTSR